MCMEVLEVLFDEEVYIGVYYLMIKVIEDSEEE